MQGNIVEFLDSLGYEYQVSKEYHAYEVHLHFDDNRSQRVYINMDTNNVNGIEFREIWSPAIVLHGPLSRTLALRLLENNSYRTIGSWVYDEEHQVVYFSCKVPDRLTEDELDSIMVAVASDADRLEQKIMKADVL